MKMDFPDYKNIFISCLILRLDNKKKTAYVLKNYLGILKKEEQNFIFHENANESHFYRDDLQLKLKETFFLAENFILRIRTFSWNTDSIEN